MEVINQKMKKLEENLKNLLKETTDKQAEKHERGMQKMKERQERDMTELHTLLLNLQPVGNGTTVNTLVDPARAEKELTYLKSIQPKLIRLEFPKFNGDNLLEGATLQWHQHFMRRKGERTSPSWEEYVAQLNVRFGSELHHDPMVELRNLRQTGSVQNYLTKFK